MRSKITGLLLALTGFLSAGPAFAGSVHGFGRAAGNCGGVWRLPDTGQTVHYSTAPGDDSDYLPAAVQPRYAVKNPVGISSVTVDSVTGLIWLTNPFDAGLSGGYSWDGALTACEGLNYATYTDWRLPNVRELQSIVDYGTAASAKINGTYFMNTQPNSYWSATTYIPNSLNAWDVRFGTGGAGNAVKTGTTFIRCVRGGL